MEYGIRGMGRVWAMGYGVWDGYAHDWGFLTISIHRYLSIHIAYCNTDTINP